MSDSLVRVSRRVNKNHFVNITTTQYLTAQYTAVKPAELGSPKPSAEQERIWTLERVVRSSAKPKVGPPLAPKGLRTAFSPESS